MFNFLAPIFVTATICLTIYKLFELFVRRKERNTFIEKLSEIPVQNLSGFSGRLPLPSRYVMEFCCPSYRTFTLGYRGWSLSGIFYCRRKCLHQRCGFGEGETSYIYQYGRRVFAYYLRFFRTFFRGACVGCVFFDRTVGSTSEGRPEYLRKYVGRVDIPVCVWDGIQISLNLRLQHKFFREIRG